MRQINLVEGKVVAPEGMKVGIVAARFNEIIVNKLLGGAVDGAAQSFDWGFDELSASDHCQGRLAVHRRLAGPRRTHFVCRLVVAPVLDRVCLLRAVLSRSSARSGRRRQERAGAG